MGKQIDLGNNETWTVGLVQDGADWLALTLTESKTFKGRVNGGRATVRSKNSHNSATCNFLIFDG